MLPLCKISRRKKKQSKKVAPETFRSSCLANLINQGNFIVICFLFSSKFFGVLVHKFSEYVAYFSISKNFITFTKQKYLKTRLSGQITVIIWNIPSSYLDTWAIVNWGWALFFIYSYFLLTYSLTDYILIKSDFQIKSEF